MSAAWRLCQAGREVVVLEARDRVGGHALRPAAGRVHWAGTETAINFMGTFDGAIESGERAAQEVLAAE